ncbi:hypothetical protein [Paraburkholderia kururiensis]|uniref:Transmembrane protein n=1 Tax=Paraburkholderia kururiensis TaxID=984307 RepID=A0ABZ0WFX8_9BURK|nr:hypothetical protein [Paraburkholderia kururiensis]WQD76275.1 hypothetical protein U0042_19455 [Paraburkholderia kururiensis]
MLLEFSWMTYFLALLALMALSIALTTLCAVPPRQRNDAPSVDADEHDAAHGQHSRIHG